MFSPGLVGRRVIVLLVIIGTDTPMQTVGVTGLFLLCGRLGYLNPVPSCCLRYHVSCPFTFPQFLLCLLYSFFYIYFYTFLFLFASITLCYPF